MSFGLDLNAFDIPLELRIVSLKPSKCQSVVLSERIIEFESGKFRLLPSLLSESNFNETNSELLVIISG